MPNINSNRNKYDFNLGRSNKLEVSNDVIEEFTGRQGYMQRYDNISNYDQNNSQIDEDYMNNKIYVQNHDNDTVCSKNDITKDNSLINEQYNKGYDITKDNSLINEQYNKSYDITKDNSLINEQYNKSYNKHSTNNSNNETNDDDIMVHRTYAQATSKHSKTIQKNEPSKIEDIFDLENNSIEKTLNFDTLELGDFSFLKERCQEHYRGKTRNCDQKIFPESNKDDKLRNIDRMNEIRFLSDKERN